MAGFVLDTDICIYWLKGNRNIEKAVVRSGVENVCISVITECELYYGAFKSSHKERNRAVIEKLKKKIKTLQTTSAVPSLYGEIKAGLEEKGEPVDDADLLIAAIALAHDATIVTNNTGHFKRIRGLKLENWK